MKKKKTPLEAALAYAEMGYPVFPCWPGTKKPMPKNGFKDAITDLEKIERFWKKNPDANIGIPTQDLIVVDIDTIDGAENPWLNDDPDKQIDLSKGAMQTTPRGGKHFIFKQPAGKHYRNTTSGLAEKVDTRADGGYIVVAPSVFEGKHYQWVEGMGLEDDKDHLTEPEDWLINLLDQLAMGDATPKKITVVKDGNMIPIGQRNSSLASMAGTMRRIGMSETEIVAALKTANEERCQSSLKENEVEKIAWSVSRYEPDQKAVAYTENHWAQLNEEQKYVTAKELFMKHKDLKPPIIHGLLREGETMNVIAAPKTGKSWLVTNLALSMTTGQPWLGFPSELGNVLLIDNELHNETLASRIPYVAKAMKLQGEDWKGRLHIRSLRGQLKSLSDMDVYFKNLVKGDFQLIILDAFYRFIPPGMDENDNGGIASLYNKIDQWADDLNCGFVLIHHTSKGIQSGKSVTDVGAGAGSQSRAADCHLILRSHEQDDCVSVDAVARSWPAPAPFVLRKEFPLWVKDETLDPKDLAVSYRRTKSNKLREEKRKKRKMTVEEFIDEYLKDEPQSVESIKEDCLQADLPISRVNSLLKLAEENGDIFRWSMPGIRGKYYSLLKQDISESLKNNKKKVIEKMVQEHPELTTKEVACRCEVSKQYVNKIRRKIESEKLER